MTALKQILEKLCDLDSSRILDTSTLCLPGGTQAFADAVLVDADFGTAVGSTIIAAPPSPTTTSTPIYTGMLNGVSYDVEFVDYFAATAPSALVRRNFIVENPVSQGGAFLPVAGFDQTIGSPGSENAFLISFATPISSWAADFLDLESDAAFQNARIALFDAAETLLVDDPIVYPAGDGDGETHEIGFTRAVADVSYVLVSVGANAANTNALTTRLAFGQMRTAAPAGSFTQALILESDGSVTCVTIDNDTKVVVTDQALIDSLEPCTPECVELCDDCGLTETQFVLCATAASAGVADDDDILVTVVTDCTNSVVSEAWWNLTAGGTQIIERPSLGPCDPARQVVAVRCIVDTNGTEWTELAVVDPNGPASAPLYISGATLGTPAGAPSTWTPCTAMVAAITPLALPATCMQVAGETDPRPLIPLTTFNAATNAVAPVGHLDPKTGALIAAVVTPADDCDCTCDCCADLSGCMFRIEGFDYLDHPDWTAGDGMTWEVDGTPVTVDVATLSPALNKSAWYQPIWDALPAGWTVAVVSDVGPTSGSKPTFEFGYDGEVCDSQTVVIERMTGTAGDTITMTVNPDGTFSASWIQGDGVTPVPSASLIQDCGGVQQASGTVSGAF